VDFMYMACGGDHNSCEHNRDLSSCMKCDNFIHYPSHCQILQKSYALWNIYTHLKYQTSRKVTGKVVRVLYVELKKRSPVLLKNLSYS
jgi:hypothetical protein